MMTALERIEVAPTVTAEQLELVKKTVAEGATADELKLYLYDCSRQGVHPLDRLIHFTVRKDGRGGRKYTPITSIDFMRIRAAETGEYAGSDDAVFRGQKATEDFEATLRVYRMVHGQRCAFEATARWSEYKPDKDDFMWRKMPHTMLAKCAEALALRKGFPKQLAGLYAKEEMEQTGFSSTTIDVVPQGVIEAPKAPDGFDKWWEGLQDVAVEGEAPLRKAWEDAPKEFRQFVAKHYLAQWEALKTKASQPQAVSA